MNPRIHLVSRDELVWSFDSGDKPRFELKTDGYPATVYVDPFPCYTHSLDLVECEVEYAESVVKLAFLPHYFILPVESTSRTNGWADANKMYLSSEDGKDKWEPRPYIVLQGKRIPLHPALTRYLISHEIGHTVHANLAHKMGFDYWPFAEMYAKDVRKIPYSGASGGLKWHSCSAEILANDFRVGVLEKETEFWPHDVECPSPEIVAWWRERIKEHLS